MELSSQEGEIPIPLNSTYGGGHGHGHGHMIHHDPAAPKVLSNGPSSLSVIEDPVPYKKPVRYIECLKNHAAAMGGNATDGCGEFMPSGEDGTIEALTCSVCHCHRNFHRKEVEGEPTLNDYCYPLHGVSGRAGRQLLLGHPHKSILPPEALGYHTGTLIHSRTVPAPTPHQMIMSYNMGGSLPSESDEQPEDGGRPLQLMKKRFRTKFSQEQKDKMFNFAEKAGWKIQKQEESVVQQFCQEIGVKRRVLKVWMHNNKHNLAKKNPSNPTPASTPAATTTTTAAC